MNEAIGVAVCIVLNAFFAAYEMAFVSVPKSELRALARRGNRRAQTLLELRENHERTLSIIQIGITLVGSLAAAIGGAGAAETLEPYFVARFGLGETSAEIVAVALIVIPLTYFNVVIGELVPKSLALRRPRKIVLAGADVLFVADRALAPVISVLEWSTKLLLTVFFQQQKIEERLAQTSIEIDTLSPTHQRFVLNMANIEKKQVRDILLPWDQVVRVNVSDSIDKVLQTILTSGHTRLPVEENSRVIGVLHTKEFMNLRESGESRWQTIIRPVLAVKPMDSAFGVLRLMQERRSHLSLVLTTAQEAIGILTLEDIVEEVIGEIFDEDDDGRVQKIFASRLKDRAKPLV